MKLLWLFGIGKVLKSYTKELFVDKTIMMYGITIGAIAIIVVAINMAAIWVPGFVDTAKSLDIAAAPTLLALIAKSPVQ